MKFEAASLTFVAPWGWLLLGFFLFLSVENLVTTMALGRVLREAQTQ